MLTQTLNQVDQALAIIGKQLSLLGLIAPLNLQSEEEKFFSCAKYNPRFKYKVNFEKLEKLEKDLRNLEIEEKKWQGFLLNEVKEKLLNDCLLAQTIGKDHHNFIELNQKKYFSEYDLTNQEALLQAEKEIKEKKKFAQNKRYNAQEVKINFESFLKTKKIDWKVVIDEKLIPLLSVSYYRQVMRIHPLIQLSPIEMQRMIIHEIETHLYRFLNGKNLFQMASNGLNRYEKTEEGLAAFNESLLFPENTNCLIRFYLRYKAVLFGEKNSFQKLYQYLCEELDFDQEESWRTAVRVKRGIQNTAFAGAFLKDKIYLQGYFAVKKLNFPEIKALYKGKFSVEHLYSKKFNLADDTLISSPKYLPSIYSELFYNEYK